MTAHPVDAEAPRRLEGPNGGIGGDAKVGGLVARRVVPEAGEALLKVADRVAPSTRPERQPS
ncbi:MAG: hypothetical protein M3Q48_05125 [Actinomycetota bacterium]|nr:hypothetical protein [Actinomycetota bacterium]HSH23743.1 hypothetical protein [Acidimicrobiales bacterium]